MLKQFNWDFKRFEARVRSEGFGWAYKKFRFSTELRKVSDEAVLSNPRMTFWHAVISKRKGLLEASFDNCLRGFSERIEEVGPACVMELVYLGRACGADPSQYIDFLSFPPAKSPLERGIYAWLGSLYLGIKPDEPLVYSEGLSRDELYELVMSWIVQPDREAVGYMALELDSWLRTISEDGFASDYGYTPLLIIDESIDRRDFDTPW